MRVSPGGAIAILNYIGSGYVPAGTVQWWVQAPGAAPVRAHRAPYPFAADGGAVLAVDFWVDDAGALVLLEKIAAGDGRASSRLAVISPAGDITRKVALDGGPYVRIVPGDGGRLFVVRAGSGLPLPGVLRAAPSRGVLAGQRARATGAHHAGDAQAGSLRTVLYYFVARARQSGFDEKLHWPCSGTSWILPDGVRCPHVAEDSDERCRTIQHDEL